MVFACALGFDTYSRFECGGLYGYHATQLRAYLEVEDGRVSGVVSAVY